MGTTDYRQRMVTSFLDVEGVDDCLHMVFAVRNEVNINSQHIALGSTM